MIVEQIWTANAYRNFHYLIACPDTHEALVLDPYEHEKCLAVAKAKGWTIKQVLNTHEHHDHIEGNQAMIAATGAKLLAPQSAQDCIPGIDRGLVAGDSVKVGNSVEFKVLDTPGHTMRHICLLSQTETPALFCGDTIFNAGAGNCHNGGDPNALYRTFAEQLAILPDATPIYPGHDYIVSNLEFTLDREPDNQRAKELLDQLFDQDPNNALVTTIGLEKEINTFMRLDSPSIIKQLRERFTDLPAQPDAQMVFVKLRELRNKW